ncbi:hypothetical protein CL684_01045 [Candidatus Campbellbacteria bacterium]|nr:hypothetical protein [Candidatus Campbellbacteria bacterium]|tara:strand:- start:370 stop:1005 length:636 start_codon:yes stop_codon:yes gene_type:complete
MRNNKQGFTIVELMVVIAGIAILLTMVLASLGDTKKNSRENLRVAGIDEVRLALEEYRRICNAYPNELDLSANNAKFGTCTLNGQPFSLGDVIAELPTLPELPDGFETVSAGLVDSGSITPEGFFYAALSDSLGGPCYEYHIGTELEHAIEKGEDRSIYLNDDHDFEDRQALRPGGTDAQRCQGSNNDFGSANPEDDDDWGLYDFRSTNNQ